MELSNIKCTCLRPQANCFSGMCSYCNRPIVENITSESFRYWIRKFKHIGKELSKEEIIANRSSAYEFIDFDKQETLEEVVYKIPKDFNIKEQTVLDMCMKEQENIILTFRLGNFIEMIQSLSDDTEKNRILKSVFNNREGELLLESYKEMMLNYEK